MTGISPTQSDPLNLFPTAHFIGLTGRWIQAKGTPAIHTISKIALTLIAAFSTLTLACLVGTPFFLLTTALLTTFLASGISQKPVVQRQDAETQTEKGIHESYLSHPTT